MRLPIVPLLGGRVRRSVLPALLAALAAITLTAPLLAVAPSASGVTPAGVMTSGSPAPQHTYRSIAGAALGKGRHKGTATDGATLTIATPQKVIRKQQRKYQVATWTSPWISPGSFNELVPSWNARTPAKSWLKVRVRVKDRQGRLSRWKNIALWATGDGRVKRSSGGSQADALARVLTDTLVAQPGVDLVAWKVRVRLAKAPKGRTPKLRGVGAVVSRRSGSAWTVPPTSIPLAARAVTLPVPTYSQMVHRGQNPEYGGGGEAWCSPTSLAMVLAHYGRLPAAKAHRWVPSAYADPWVNNLARRTYDHRYRGAGNWPFNTAFAAVRTDAAFVTRLDDLAMAERFVRAGIPLIVSVKFARGGLSGAPITSTNGHLLVLVGFTATGDPVVNDPAGGSNSAVRRTYDRAQLERAWLGGSGGLTYVVHDAAHPLPARPAGSGNW